MMPQALLQAHSTFRNAVMKSRFKKFACSPSLPHRPAEAAAAPVAAEPLPAPSLQQTLQAARAGAGGAGLPDGAALRRQPSVATRRIGRGVVVETSDEYDEFVALKGVFYAWKFKVAKSGVRAPAAVALQHKMLDLLQACCRIAEAKQEAMRRQMFAACIANITAHPVDASGCSDLYGVAEMDVAPSPSQAESHLDTGAASAAASAAWADRGRRDDAAAGSSGSAAAGTPRSQRGARRAASLKPTLR